MAQTLANYISVFGIPLDKRIVLKKKYGTEGGGQKGFDWETKTIGCQASFLLFS